MTRRIERSPRVWRDLEEIGDYIAKDNLDAALRFLDAAEAAFEKLAETPGMGAMRTFQNTRLGTVRMQPIRGFENWLIFYRATEEGIEALRVIHTARDIGRLFGKEEEESP